MARILVKTVFCILPLALTPLLGFLIADGYLNFGAGEKDLFLLVPWFLWSIFYTVIFIVAWMRRKSILRVLLYSAGGATALLLFVAVALYLVAPALLGIRRG